MPGWHLGVTRIQKALSDTTSTATQGPWNRCQKKAYDAKTQKKAPGSFSFKYEMEEGALIRQDQNIKIWSDTALVCLA